MIIIVSRVLTHYLCYLTVLTLPSSADILIIPPSETPLNSIIDILHRNSKTRAIFIVKDPNKFTLSYLDDPSLPAFQNLIEDKKISFLLTEKRQIRFFINRISSFFEEEEDRLPFPMAERVRAYTPLMDTPIRQPAGPHKQRLLHYGVFYNDDNSKNSIKHINSIVNDVGQWIKRDSNATGYDIVKDPSSGKNMIAKRTKGYGIISLHIFFPPHLDMEHKLDIQTKLNLPNSLKGALFVHTGDNPHSLYTKVSKMVSSKEINVLVG